MKILLKILFAPIMALMWIAIKIGSLMTYISGLALGIISGIIVVISIVYMLTGAGMNGFIGLVIAYLLSPYGISMFMIIMLGVIQRIRENLKYIIYG
ncbi:MAG: CD1845 family protein [Clostridia bacterium]|nr:CD1845 family protein [Clostridia bacterium]